MKKLGVNLPTSCLARMRSRWELLSSDGKNTIREASPVSWGPTMQLNLSQNLLKLIDERVRSGQYASPDQVVAAALHALEQQEWLGDFAAGEMDELLAEGERSLEQEGPLDGDEAIRRRRERRARSATP